MCVACRLTLEQRYELCRSVAQECIQEDELRASLKWGMDAGKRLVAYDGFEPSGRMHIAQVRELSQHLGSSWR